MIAEVKYVKRVSGSVAKEGDSKREKVCVTFIPSSWMAPGYMPVILHLPAQFLDWLKNMVFSSGVLKEARAMV